MEELEMAATMFTLHWPTLVTWPPCCSGWELGSVFTEGDGNWILCSQREMGVYGDGAICHHWQDSHWRDRQWAAGPAAEKTFLVPLWNSSQKQKEKQQG